MWARRTEFGNACALFDGRCAREYPQVGASCWKGSRVVKKRTISIGLGLILACALNVAAQVKVGDNLSMNMNGQASVGYTADYGNLVSSDHGITFGGNADLTGFYYDPNFLSFTVEPFYNQSRLNSNYASNSLASGLSTSANLFSGGHFPGTISYFKNWNSDGIIGLPGVGNYTTTGTSDAFGVGWGVYFPNRPTLSVNYQQGSNQYSIPGDTSNGSTGFHSFAANSLYQVAGWTFNGGYQYSSSHSNFPLLFGSDELQQANATNNSFSAGAGHPLPWDGNFAVNFNHSNFNTNFGQVDGTQSSHYSGGANTASAALSFHPVDRLTVGSNVNYTDNLLGSLYQSIITTDGVIVINTPGQTTDSLDVTGYATYQLTKHWNLYGSAEYRDQNNLGVLIPISQTGTTVPSTSLSSEAFTATATYTGDFKGGVLSALGGFQANEVNTFNNSNTIGLVGSVNYSKAIGNWGLAGGVNYAQNTQTALVGLTTSNMGYTFNMLRNMGKWRWAVTAGGSKSVLNRTGYSTFVQNYSTTFSGRWIGVSGTYSRSSGNALLASTGLVPNPLPPVVLPSELIFYGGDGWSVGLGSNPTRHLSMSASYSKAQSNTGGDLTPFSFNHNEQINARIQYQVRQLYFQAGYSRLVQGFSSSPTPPALFGSYYVGIQRWFNFF